VEVEVTVKVKPSKLLRKNMIYIPIIVQREMGVKVGDKLQWRIEDGRLYLEVVR
jgi:hypothetical protein